jgi:hypothetical protein
VAVHDEPGAGATGAGAGSVDQVDHVGESRLGCARQQRVGVFPEHAEQPPHLTQCLTRSLADCGESFGAFGRTLDGEAWLKRVTPVAGLAIQQTRDRFDDVIGPWPGIAVLGAWVAVALVAAVVLVRRRDA